MPQHLLHIIGCLVILALMKGAAAVAGGSAALLAQAGYTAAEAVLLAAALTAFKVPPPAGKKISRRPAKAGENPVFISLVLALLIFAGGCALLWTVYSLPFTSTPAAAAQTFYFAALLILIAEVVLWRRVLTTLKRLHNLADAAVGLSCRRDLLLLIAALCGALAARGGFPAADLLVSAAIAMLILLQALNLAHRALTNLGSDLGL